MKLILVFPIIIVLLSGCASDDRKLFLNEELSRATSSCGTESYLNRYATFQCQSMELEENNDYVNKELPIHNIKNVLGSQTQRLLVIDEKIFSARLREKDQEVVCNRRLQVILNPGVGPKDSYQRGWVNYEPRCFSFYNVKQKAGGEILGPLFTKSKTK